MRIRKSLSAGALLLGMATLASCANTMSKAELRVADYGPYPRNYRRVISNYLMKNDRDVAQVLRFQTIRGPDKQSRFTIWSGMQLGWRICGLTDTRQKDGSTEYGKHHFFLIRDGKVVFHDGATGGEIWVGGAALWSINHMCQKDPAS